MPLRVAFLTTHPIQYQVPVFRELSRRQELDLTALFCQIPDATAQGDGFGVKFEWDVPLLDGYRYEVLRNIAKRPSVTAYHGCDTPEIAARIRRGDFDAIVVNGWVVKSCLQTLHACRRLGIPCIVRGEANLLRPRPWWKHWLHRRLVRKFSAYVYIGQANREFYKRHGAADDRLFPSPYCVDNARFSSESKDQGRRVRPRQRWGIEEDRVCYLFSGKFEAKKHPLELLEAFSTAVDSCGNMHLLMVGDGALRPACQRFADERGLPVTFTGFLNQSEIADAYVAADCLVLPSDHGETWGLVVNEAMACGRAAIVSDQVGCRQDLVIERRTGLSFPFGNWSELAGRLADLASDQCRLRRMGEAAAEQVAKYSPAAAADGIAQAVEFVANGNR